MGAERKVVRQDGVEDLMQPMENRLRLSALEGQALVLVDVGTATGGCKGLQLWDAGWMEDLVEAMGRRLRMIFAFLDGMGSVGGGRTTVRFRGGLWYSDECDWVMKESIGASGGLICVWNTVNFVKLGEFVGDGFLGIEGIWGAGKVLCYFVNVYASQDKCTKARLWEELGTMVMEKGGCWMIAGDFNAIRCPKERRGRTGVCPEMEEFNVFIESTKLVDIRLANRRFTWYRPDGSSMSRLDRFLMTEEMYSLGCEWVQQGMKRTISDHCAVILKTRIADWGPRPFRVLDAWQQHPDFKNAVEGKWRGMEVEGYAGYRCKQKLKMLKEFLKGWNRDVFGDMEAQFEMATVLVEKIDRRNEDFDLEEFEVSQRHDGVQEIWDILRKKEAIWRQKSRCNWVRMGDANTRFFHKIANGRRAQNNILGISCDGRWVEEPTLVKREKKEWLERPFSTEEIEEGLRGCEGTKAPGPDGYNFNFIKFAWSILKEDFVSFFNEFHSNGRLVRGLNSSFLTLIPKKNNPIELKDYRPINLIRCVYKLLAKVLANRLKAVLSEIISETQSAFLGGRQLADSVLALNEVVDEIKKSKQKAFVFKADFAKAYDCVDWAFLDWMMERFGFGVRWRGWIMECLSTAKVSVLVNGSPTEEFEIGKGLRQGDPLSPFLFLMVGEGLHGLIRKSEEEGLFRGVEVGKKGLVVSLLEFADDTVILGKADGENVFMVKAVLRWFELMSGLRINFSKSSVYGFNVSTRWLNGMACSLRCGVGKTPFLYLGLPIGGGFCGGGAGLSRKIPWVKWDVVCGNKAQGGLGVSDLRRKNWALLGKWWFRFGDGVGSLWKRVVREKYYEGRCEVDITAISNLRVSKVWKDIISIGGRSVRLRNMLGNGFRWEVGCGSRVGFWREKWAGDNSLRDLCPRLFALAANKEGLVGDMGEWVGDRWQWNLVWRRGRMGREKDEEEALWGVVDCVHLKKGQEDIWSWIHDPGGKYLVKTAYEFLSPEERHLDTQYCRLIWCSKRDCFVVCVMRGWRM
ncbi:hypothetical protein SLEP1_g14507 [Rubroshorea leprosula]|uniref:Reverse transcriptase domain-containing protein n=1 Tax=Rubroshorea leprosula TaxID=152421 RepID=A0AAV5INQ6_9ROSI|nr:hypothetical protein SLEP1_g14507 [Rubroshorea leprosula]